MRQRCEVCENFRPDLEFAGDRNTVLVPFDVRAVRLCMGHARIAAKSSITTFEELRDFYGSGRRSFVPRRGAGFETAMDEQRGSPGRRATDHSPLHTFE
ncbi:MAG TPA: hypothetical protein VH062_17655 [Polyangiaceae bacterium]|jgi:hypothetical protein|nr:hypothetical protein [Polyangiaceae bacterium]